MGTVTSTIDSLIGGVSQQPESTRLPSQCEAQDNAYSSIVDGLMKRQPVEMIRHLSELAALNLVNPYVHWINRDSSERYLVLFDEALPDKVAIFDATDGTKMDVTDPGGAALSTDTKNYITANATGSNLQALTIADTSFVLNRDQVCAMDSTLLSDAIDVDPGGGTDLRAVSSRRLFLFVRSTGPLREYAVRFWTTLEDGRHDPPVDTQAELDATVAILRLHDGTFGSNKHGSKNHTPPYDPAFGQLSGWQLASFKPDEVAQAIYTAAKRSGGAPSKTYNGGIRARWIDQNRKISPDIRDVLTHNLANSDMPQGSSVLMFELNKSDKTASHFRKEIDLQVVKDGGEGSLIIFKDTVERFTQLPLFCKDGHIVKVQNDPEAEEGVYYVEFERTTSTGILGPGDAVGPGDWKESLKPLSEYRINKITMPHQIERKVNGPSPKGFRFEISAVPWTEKKVGDDESNPPPSFIGEKLEYMFFWRNRLGFLSGSRLIMSEADEFFNFWRTTVTTQPDNDMIDDNAGATKVNRLRSAVPIEDKLILFSDRSQFVVGGDPLLTPKTVSVKPATEYENYADLEPVATDKGIFFGYPSGTPPYSKVREYKRLEDGGDSFKAFETAVQIPRYIKGKILELAAAGSEQLLVVRTDDLTSPQVLWIYKWFDSGNKRVLSAWQRYVVGTQGQKIHGMVFIENELHLFLEIANGAGGGEDQFFLEKMVFADKHTDIFPQGLDPTDRGAAESDYLTLLDHKITENDCVLTYDATNETLDIELPYQADLLGHIQIISRAHSNTGGSKGTATAEGIEWEVDSQTVTVVGGINVSTLKIKDQDKSKWISLGSPTTGDQSKGDRATRLFVGQRYVMSYEFTRQTLRQRTISGALGDVKSGRYQLLRGSVNYHDSAHFEVEVAPATHKNGSPTVQRPTFTYVLTPMVVGVGSSLLGNVNVRDGRLRFPVRSLPANVRIRILNSSPFPSNFKKVDWEGDYTTKAAAWRV